MGRGARLLLALGCALACAVGPGCQAGRRPWALEPHLLEAHGRVTSDPDGAPAYDRIRCHYVEGRRALEAGDPAGAGFSFRLVLDCFGWLHELSPEVEQDPDDLRRRSLVLLRQLEGRGATAE